MQDKVYRAMGWNNLQDWITSLTYIIEIENAILRSYNGVFILFMCSYVLYSLKILPKYVIVDISNLVWKTETVSKKERKIYLWKDILA